MTDTTIFVVLVSFWVFLTFFSYAFDTQLSTTDISSFKPDSQQTNTNDNIFSAIITTVLDFASNLPLVNVFVPLLRILTFQYVSVPPLVTIFLDMTAILSGFVILRTIRGV